MGWAIWRLAWGAVHMQKRRAECWFHDERIPSNTADADRTVDKIKYS